MRLKEETQDALLHLKLPDVPPEWVDSLWEDNFCSEALTLPGHGEGEGEALLSEEGWERLVEACEHWPQVQDRESKYILGASKEELEVWLEDIHTQL